jgi:hypothetical protein
MRYVVSEAGPIITGAATHFCVGTSKVATGFKERNPLALYRL